MMIIALLKRNHNKQYQIKKDPKFMITIKSTIFKNLLFKITFMAKSYVMYLPNFLIGVEGSQAKI